jgi:hypothetical protein
VQDVLACIADLHSALAAHQVQIFLFFRIFFQGEKEEKVLFWSRRNSHTTIGKFLNAKPFQHFSSILTRIHKVIESGSNPDPDPYNRASEVDPDPYNRASEDNFFPKFSKSKFKVKNTTGLYYFVPVIYENDKKCTQKCFFSHFLAPGS